MSSETTSYMPFDELRNVPEIARQGRADIVFGPDMFDPRPEDTVAPLTNAFHVAVQDGALADLGIVSEKDYEGKTIGEVFGDIGPTAAAQRFIEISERITPYLPTEVPKRNFLQRLLSFARQDKYY